MSNKPLSLLLLVATILGLTAPVASAMVTRHGCEVLSDDAGDAVAVSSMRDLEAKAPALDALLSPTELDGTTFKIGAKAPGTVGRHGHGARGGRGGMSGTRGMSWGGAREMTPGSLAGGVGPRTGGGGGWTFRQPIMTNLDAQYGMMATSTGMLRFNGDATYALGPIYAGVGLGIGTQIGAASAVRGATGARRRLAGGAGASGSQGRGASPRGNSLLRLGSGANAASAELVLGSRTKLGKFDLMGEYRYSGSNAGTFDGSVGLPF